MSLLLSILIPTIPERDFEYNRLMSHIWAQTKKLDNMIVQVESYIDRKEMTIGEKREILYKMAQGLYSWQIDDDDLISDNAIDIILDVIKVHSILPSTLPDCITFEEHIDIDGKIQRSNHSLKYHDWQNDFDGFDYVRTPFMKSVIKTAIAKSVPIPHVRFGEDHQWAQALKPHLKTEIHIPEQIYRYIHRSTDFNERYGIKNM